jgi:L-2-hydroxyglutarate oxidase
MISEFDVVIIGGGVNGCAIARELSSHFHGRFCLIEKENSVALHTSGRNSGVIHSGINQKPGTLKAKLVVKGNRIMREYCKKKSIPMEQIGTLVVANNDEEVKTLRELERRAKENGVPSVSIISSNDLKKIEPNIVGVEALISPTGSIVDSKKLVEALASDASNMGVDFFMNTKLLDVKEYQDHIDIFTNNKTFRTKFLVNCAGLYADKIAHALGVGKDYIIIPFKGGYYKLISKNENLIKTMVYSTPNLEVPFLGVHFTKMVDGAVFIGPNASLAPGREAYNLSSINLFEMLSYLFNIRFLRLILNRGFLNIALRELWLTLSREAFTNDARKLLPQIQTKGLMKMPPGIRAQLVDKKGNLVGDFVYKSTKNSYHILNAVSPAFTSSMAFAEKIISDLQQNQLSWLHKKEEK